MEKINLGFAGTVAILLVLLVGCGGGGGSGGSGDNSDTSTDYTSQIMNGKTGATMTTHWTGGVWPATELGLASDGTIKIFHANSADAGGSGVDGYKWKKLDDTDILLSNCVNISGDYDCGTGWDISNSEHSQCFQRFFHCHHKK